MINKKLLLLVTLLSVTLMTSCVANDDNKVEQREGTNTSTSSVIVNDKENEIESYTKERLITSDDFSDEQKELVKNYVEQLLNEEFEKGKEEGLITSYECKESLFHMDSSFKQVKYDSTALLSLGEYQIQVKVEYHFRFDIDSLLNRNEVVLFDYNLNFNFDDTQQIMDIWESPNAVYLEKSEETLTSDIEDIALKLIEAWFAHFEKWEDNRTFVIQNINDFKVHNIISCYSNDWSETLYGNKYMPDGAIESWLVFGTCKFELLGYAKNAGEYYGGHPFMSDAYIANNMSDFFGFITQHFVLVEYEDKYELKHIKSE